MTSKTKQNPLRPLAESLGFAYFDAEPQRLVPPRELTPLDQMFGYWNDD